MAPPAVVLLNPLAAQGRAGELRRPVGDWLARHAPGVPLLSAPSVTEARALLTILAPRTRIALIGGDGTLHAMLPALLKGGLRVGLVPGGQANRIGQGLHLDTLGWTRALMHALHAPTAPVDIGLLETDATMLHFAGLVRLEAPRPLVLWINQRRLALRPPTTRLRICNLPPPIADGDPPERVLPVLADDQLMHVLCDPPRPAWRRLFGPDRRPPARPASSVRVECELPMQLQVDGEMLLPSRSARVDVLPGALEMTGSHVPVLDPHRLADTSW
ncbi:diacylglycerol/lipid kinase family protein [Sphaerotilus uruguayifluvii]|uniref:DAGKc domain-containing protein n=1 Tax=Sphaerotilus uruguayifluvii TaxID=2735897 RepID=A0ABX2G2D1_9BURK|nr:hypothetical protein [Leptothrix sp. C29]